MININSIKGAICINCGKTWGGHSGILCNHGRSYKKMEFEPIGFNLSDICIHCGKTLMDHYSRYYCVSSDGRRRFGAWFEKDSILFSDEDFEL